MSGTRMHVRLRQQGAALVVGLVLLAVLTLLGVSGMSSAILEQTVANNARFQQEAFEAAETGIEIAIAERRFAAPGEVTLALDAGREVQIITTFEAVTAPPPGNEVPNADATGADMDALHFRVSAEDALHFRITAIGRGPRGAISSQHQGVYVLAPRGASPAQLATAGRVVRTYWSEEVLEE